MRPAPGPGSDSEGAGELIITGEVETLIRRVSAPRISARSQGNASPSLDPMEIKRPQAPRRGAKGAALSPQPQAGREGRGLQALGEKGFSSAATSPDKDIRCFHFDIFWPLFNPFFSPHHKFSPPLLKRRAGKIGGEQKSAAKFIRSGILLSC